MTKSETYGIIITERNSKPINQKKVEVTIMTKKEMFEKIANLVDDVEVKEFCAHEIEILSKKRSSANSKKKAETAERAERLYNALAEMDKPVTFKELKALTSDEEVQTYSPQRMSALVRFLGDRVHKEYIKKDAYFTVA